MPALSWEIEEAEHEGCQIPLPSPRQSRLSTDNGKAKGLECIKMKMGKT